MNVTYSYEADVLMFIIIRLMSKFECEYSWEEYEWEY